jgi:hypothetical protein
MIWTFNEARARGYSVDEQALQEITDWAFDMKRNSLTEQAPPRNVLNLGWVYLLLSVETADPLERSTNRTITADPVFKEDELIRSTRQTLIQQIIAKQAADGSWGPPLDLRVPLGGPVEDIAILARTALIEVSEPSPAMADCIKRAGDWLDANHEHTSWQGKNLRLLMDLIERKPAPTLTNTLAAIEREQNSDGGWSQTPEMESDAYGTGQTLYVLARAGVNPEAPCLRRGVAFLTRTQLSDGAWPMTSRVNAKNLVPIKGAGTAWAVLGLLRASPCDSHGPDKEK